MGWGHINATQEALRFAIGIVESLGFLVPAFDGCGDDIAFHNTREDLPVNGAFEIFDERSILRDLASRS